jgi:D-alanyl-D-alanine carboxypeptidase-like protein
MDATRATVRTVLGVAVLLVAAACGTRASPIDAPSSSNLTSPPRPTPSPAASGRPSPLELVFHGSITGIDQATRARMKDSWHSWCPVAIEDLRLLTLDYVGFDGRVHAGEMVVHRDVARDVVTVFGKLFDAKFPIRRMRLVDDYGGDDDRSMAAGNTSGFNCRPVTGGASWSEHAYGRAIDVNPIQNPYVTGTGTVEPPAGASYVDRSLRAEGMIHPGDAAVHAFAFVGWRWGGEWSNPTDYQHFSSTGR